MPASDPEVVGNSNGNGPPAGKEVDVSITCMDCSQSFVWTAGEQVFFRHKNLLNPPKRCKPCKQAKNGRLRAIEAGRRTGHRQHFEIEAVCARCQEVTTVPFYPSQGRPVYCRACFIEMKSQGPIAAGSQV
jgi:CxxC-x17-CxxC domain-containing protein